MDCGFHGLVENFVSLGGVAENICLRKGGLGRGVFPVDPSRRAKIVTPKKLLIDCNNICICNDEICVKDGCQLSPREKKFIELNYNFAWKDGGNVCAADSSKHRPIASASSLRAD